MRIVDQGIAAASIQGTKQQSCTFPGICVLPSGRWLLGFRGGLTKQGLPGQAAMLTWSDDQGKTWAPSSAPFTTPPIGQRPGLFRTIHPTSLGGDRVLASLCWVDQSDPTLAFFNEETEGLLDARIFHAISEDGGETWSEPVLMDSTPFRVPVPTTGPLLVLPNGEWACQFELNKHYNDPEPWRHSSVLMFSADQGHTWPEHSIASNDPANRFFYWDQRPSVLSDGKIFNVFWTYDSREAKYLNMHARSSADSGRTWSALWDTGVPGQAAPVVELAGGLLALVYVDRTEEPVIKVRTSTDGGKAWPDDTELVIARPQAATQNTAKTSMQDAWAEMSNFSIGLPHTARTNDGDLLVVYYSGPETDQTGIEWARIAKGG